MAGGLCLACGADGELDTKLSTELAAARFEVLESLPTLVYKGKTQTSLCARKLRDANTGGVYVLAASHTPEPAVRDPASTSEQGDYFREMAGATAGRASHHVRLECGTWKPLGTVRVDPGDH
jgi:hypothetical protein